MHPNLQEACLVAARRKLYKSGSLIRNDLKKYPEELQSIFLELLNRRLDQGKSYKNKIHPLDRLKPIVKDFFVDTKDLEEWWIQKHDILSELAKAKIETPHQDRIQYHSLNKFLQEKYNATHTQQDFRKEVSSLYQLLAKIHFDGIAVSLDELTKIWQETHLAHPTDSQKLKTLIPRIQDHILILYQASYYPPTSPNSSSLSEAHKELVEEKVYSRYLSRIIQSIDQGCHKKNISETACKSLKDRFQNLILMNEVIKTLQKIDRQFHKNCPIRSGILDSESPTHLYK